MLTRLSGFWEPLMASDGLLGFLCSCNFRLRFGGGAAPAPPSRLSDSMPHSHLLKLALYSLSLSIYLIYLSIYLAIALA